MLSQVPGRRAVTKIKAFVPAMKSFALDAEKQRFSAYFTRSRREIMKAQRLRYRVFSEAYGASFKAPFGLDRDRYDRHCLHLVVRDNHSGELVGYTRVLPAERAQRLGGFYSAGEFCLQALQQLSGQLVEVGRTCIHPDYRSGAVIGVLWGRLTQYLLEQQVDFVIGCASIGLDEGYNLAAIDAWLQQRHRLPDTLSARPRMRLTRVPGVVNSADSKPAMPPLLKAYLRMNARIGGEPCWDPAFNCVDYFILQAVADMPSRYLQHFTRPAQAV